MFWRIGKSTPALVQSNFNSSQYYNSNLKWKKRKKFWWINSGVCDQNVIMMNWIYVFFISIGFKSKYTSKEITKRMYVILLRHFCLHSTRLSSDSLLIFGTILTVAGIGFSLCRIFDIWVVQQILKKMKRSSIFSLKINVRPNTKTFKNYTCDKTIQ